MDDLRQALQRGIGQSIFEQDGFKRAAPFVVTKLHARRIKGDRAGFGGDTLHHAFWDEEKLGVVVHKTLDEPRTGHTIHVHMRAGQPFHFIASFSGWTARKLKYNARSYTIFNAPATKNGALNQIPFRTSGPAKSGATEAPSVRATPVTPAAAERSSGRTIAIVYAWRVGTSI